MAMCRDMMDVHGSNTEGIAPGGSTEGVALSSEGVATGRVIVEGVACS